MIISWKFYKTILAFNSILISKIYNIIKRLELDLYYFKYNLNKFNTKMYIILYKFLYFYFPHIYNYNELLNNNILRNYLIKSYRGRRLITKKPNRGQRTRSNATTAKKCIFINLQILWILKRWGQKTNSKLLYYFNKKTIALKYQKKKWRRKIIY